jgi:hypothetical protein
VFLNRRNLVDDARVAARLRAALSTRLHLAIVRPMAALATAAVVIAASAVPASADFVSENSTTDPTTGAITTTVTTTVDMDVTTTIDPTSGTTTTSDPTTGLTTTTTTDPTTGTITTTVVDPTTDTTTTTTTDPTTGITTGATTTTTTNPTTGAITTTSTDPNTGATTTSTTDPTTGVITTTTTDPITGTTTTVAVDPTTGSTQTTTADATTGAITTTDTTPPDPLHGYCSVGCIDNGTNSPTLQNPITGFGFTISPVGPQAGDLVVDVLVPDSVTKPTGLAITGTGTTNTGTATLFNATAWTSGDLGGPMGNYLGITASPTNPIGAYLPSTQVFDPTATGFWVYQLNLGTTTLQGPKFPNTAPLLNIVSIPLGSYILGFLNTGTSKNPNWIATANSGAIFEGPEIDAASGTTAIALLLGVLLLTSERRRWQVPQIGRD